MMRRLMGKAFCLKGLRSSVFNSCGKTVKGLSVTASLVVFDFKLMPLGTIFLKTIIVHSECAFGMCNQGSLTERSCDISN